MNNDNEDDEDPDQDPKELHHILEKIKKWKIHKENVHKGATKRVYVKSETNIEPKDAWAYLTSIKQTMKKPDTLVKEYKYTRYLHNLFPKLIIPEHPINAKNTPLTNILNAGRGLLITKKPIVKDSVDPDDDDPDEATELLKYMMKSTDILIDHGFANLDLKAPNIGLTDGLYINDNGSNMFYPIPDKYKEYYRDAIKLIGLCNLSGLNKKIFDDNRHLYPTINLNRALELCIVGLNKKEEAEIIAYAKRKMKRVRIDGKIENLGSLFDDILFPKTLVEHYGTDGSYDLIYFMQKLKTMGLFETVKELNDAKTGMKEKERLRRTKEHNNLTKNMQKQLRNLQREQKNMGAENNSKRAWRRMSAENRRTRRRSSSKSYPNHIQDTVNPLIKN